MKAAALFAFALLVAEPAWAQDLAIVHARAYAVPGQPPVEDATILVHAGQVQAVGAGLRPPPGVEVVDAGSAIVTPGLMNGATQLGLVDVASTSDGIDQAVSSGPLGAAFDVQYGIDPNSELIAVARADGLTRAMALPTGSAGAPFAGLGAVLRLGAGDVLDRPQAAEVVVVGGATVTQSGGSRAAQWQILRNALDEARRFRERRGPGLAVRDQLLNHLDAEALGPVVEGRTPLAIRAERESDIGQAIALAAADHVKVVIVGGAEAWRLADRLARARIPVVLDPFADLPVSLDQIGARPDNAVVLAKAGVTIAFAQTDGMSSIYTSYLAGEALRESAGLAVAHGLPWNAALQAITSGPARIWGLADHYGAIAPGMDADLVVWHGDPLDVSGWPTAVYVRGQPQSLRTRQTALRERYAPGRTQAAPASASTP